VIAGLGWALYAGGGGSVPFVRGYAPLVVFVGAVFAMPFVLYGLQRLFPHLWYRPWQCRRCGYDLRATPDGAPCPECGREKPTPAAPG
jgi:hypothetical protein